jgi:hypothetical protein
LPGTEACAGVAELARRVGTHLKRDAFVSPAKATVLVDASIQPAEPGFRVRIVLSSSDQTTPGERALTSLNPDCNEAVESAALAIALMLDPDALTRSAQPADTPPTDVRANATTTAPTAPPAPRAIELSKPAPGTPKSETSEQPPAGHPRALGSTQLATGALGASDQLPGNSFGVMAGVRRSNQARSWGIDLNLVYLAPRQLELRTGAGGRFSLLGGGISGVWSPLHRAPLGLSLLAGPQIAHMFASGFGFTGSNRDVGSWLVSATVEGELAVGLSERWDLLLRLGLGVPVWRDTFEASVSGGTTAILKPAPFFGTLKAAVAFSP